MQSIRIAGIFGKTCYGFVSNVLADIDRARLARFVRSAAAAGHRHSEHQHIIARMLSPNGIQSLRVCACVFHVSCFVRLQIAQNDGLPASVCNECYQQLTSFHAFCQQAIKSDQVQRRNAVSECCASIAIRSNINIKS